MAKHETAGIRLLIVSLKEVLHLHFMYSLDPCQARGDL